jgi:hypothetical protein
MKLKLSIYSQPNYLTRTAIEVKILFAVWLSKKQALTGGKSLARENKCGKPIGASSPPLKVAYAKSYHYLKLPQTGLLKIGRADKK